MLASCFLSAHCSRQLHGAFWDCSGSNMAAPSRDSRWDSWLVRNLDFLIFLWLTPHVLQRQASGNQWGEILICFSTKFALSLNTISGNLSEINKICTLIGWHPGKIVQAAAALSGSFLPLPRGYILCRFNHRLTICCRALGWSWFEQFFQE